MRYETDPVGIFLLSAVLFVFLSSLHPASANEYICAEIPPITQFHNGDTIETLVIYGGLSDTSTKILVPSDLEVYMASLSITGESIENEPAMDIVMVNDISGSMNESLEDMKNDTKEFLNLLLTHPYNKAGLVIFETEAEIRKELTSNKEELFGVIDSYETGDRTCVACGIERGIEILRERGTPLRAMVLMTNAHANRCTYGACDPEMAKKQAISKAEEAWYYGIKIYTIPYSEDSDVETLREISNVSHGKFYEYGTPMEDIYSDIEVRFSGSPSDVLLDIGNDGNEEFFHPGEFMGTESVNFTAELQNILPECDCEGCEISGDDCIITLKVSSATTGIITFGNLMITGCINQTNETCGNGVYEPENGEECDNGEANVDNMPPVWGFEEGQGDRTYCSTECKIYEVPGTWCGDGVVQEEHEECETDADCNEGEQCSGCECVFEGTDNDGDGYTSDVDCNDNDASVHPGAAEICDGKDNDCDGAIDEGCGGTGGGSAGYTGGPGGSRACGDGVVQSVFEECEKDEDCGHGYVCKDCECVFVCAEDWKCSEWSECSPEGIQTRTCEDVNKCGTTEKKPSESQPCHYTAAEEAEVKPAVSQPVCGNGECEENENCESCPDDCGECAPEITGAGITGLFTGLQATGLFGLLVLLAIALILLFALKKRKKK